MMPGQIVGERKIMPSIAPSRATSLAATDVLNGRATACAEKLNKPKE
jgi:hypothetical protein